MKMKNNLKVSLLLTAALLAACTRNGPPAKVQYDQSLASNHTVKRGESLSSIATRYRMDKDELIRINSIKRPYRVVVGQRLLVRPPSTEAELGDRGDESTLPAGRAPLAGAPRMSGDVEVTELKPIGGAEDPKQVLKADEATKGTITEVEVPAEDGSIAPAVQPANLDVDTPAVENTAPEPPILDKPDMPKSTGYQWPVQGKIVKDFGSAAGKTKNDGINIMAPSGTPVNATNGGVVSYAGTKGGFGKVVLVKHDSGMMSIYAHLEDTTVNRGDIVTAGQKIGTVGKTGVVKSPQLHFELRKGTQAVDPRKHLS
jgi:lipoprotein NlpD